MSPQRILLIDDEQHIADVVVYMLRQHGFEVFYASSGEKGLAILRDKSPSLVLLDLNLPGMPGLELFGEIKKTAPALPVIMLTCRGEEVDRVLGLEMGADDYVTKPFSARELAARVKSVLRRAGAPPAEGGRPIRFGPLQCDPEGLSVIYGGSPVSLTRAEFEIMKALIAFPARVFSRDALIRRIYNEAHPVTDRTIDASIKRIRRKLLDARAGVDPIETVYGVGYKLNPALEDLP